MPKRGENIRKRKDGRWEARYKDKTGKYKSVYGKSYKETKEKLNDRRNAEENLLSTKKQTDDSITFQSVCEQWLCLKKLKIKISSYSNYHTIVYNHLIPFWKDKNINEINFQSETIQLVEMKLEENLSVKRIQEIIGRLKQILKFAKRQYDIQNIDIEVDLQQYFKTEIKVLSEEEQKKLIDVLLIKKDVRKLGVLISLFMGLRIGEVCALKWSDIDLVAGTLTISKTLQRVKCFDEVSSFKTKIVVDTPKSLKSRRCLPIPLILLKMLKEYQNKDNTYILTGKSENYIEPRQYENILNGYLKEADIRKINYHILRHTFATRAIEKNIDVKTLSEILGHSSIAITLQLYVHPSMEDKKKSIEKIAS